MRVLLNEITGAVVTHNLIITHQTHAHVLSSDKTQTAEHYFLNLRTTLWTIETNL